MRTSRRKGAEKAMPEGEGLTRRDLLKASGVAVSGLALGGAVVGAGAGKALAKQQEQCEDNACNYPVGPGSTQHYTYPTHLSSFTPDMQPQLDEDEMRITFLGTDFPPARRAQQMMSIFVEVGPWVPDPNGGFGKATDSFVLDCGAGALTNYDAMGITFSRMDKIFISHLHADHMSDLTAIYCFGPSADRKWPLYVWGQGPSGVVDPNGNSYDDGTNAFCENLRKAMRWHTESFSFLPTSYTGYPIPTQADWGTPCPLVPVGDDPPDDGYGLVPIQLDWTVVGGVAYQNKDTGVRITHFPVVHARKGSMGYKVEWWPSHEDTGNPGKPHLSMIYTSDTRPETVSIGQAGGVDVFIHEMILPPELLAMKELGLPAPAPGDPVFELVKQSITNVEESSHTPQGAFGYLLSQVNPRPRLAVIAHFPATDDTVKCAMNSVRAHFPKGGYPEFGKDIIWSTDLMVLRVKKAGITQLMGKVSDYTFSPPANYYPVKSPKYPTPIFQLDTTNVVPPGDNTYCENGY